APRRAGNLRGRGLVSRGAGGGVDDAAAIARNTGRRTDVVPPASRASGGLATVRCSRRDASRVVDGHERRLRSGGSGRGDDGASWNGNLRQSFVEAVSTQRRCT